ncbi:MAG TPA: phage/plasmid replication protein [Pyrinomonadaceae bacterium]|nr:phage/plasmid replication protein [Pyrinomonadaceae bacterium]
MIDTVQVRHIVPMPSPAEMLKRGWSTSCGHVPIDGEGVRWKFNQPSSLENVLPRLTWSATPSGMWLSAEVSLPKLLYGNNVVLLADADVWQGVDKISNYVSGIALTDFNARTALVGRVDYCWNFPVGETNILHYITLAASAFLSRMIRSKIDETTVTWRNLSKMVSFYGKRAEVAKSIREGRATPAQEQDADGLLRLEARYLRPDSVRRTAKSHNLPERNAQYLLAGSVAYDELARTLEITGMDQATPIVDMRLDKLREKFSAGRCRSLMGFLAYLARYGEGFYRDPSFGYSRSAYYRDARDLKRCGVWLKTDTPLPPLRLIRS